jgi:hypothetical protein
MPYIGKTPTVGNFQVCDAISVVNGQAAYTLQVGGVNVAPESANHMLVSLNGILQKPGSSFTISGSTMTFASNLATGDVIDFVQILGNVLDLGTPSDDTVTAAKLNNDIISGQTALTSSPDDTDELLISDAGTLKRIDVSLVGGTNTPNFLALPSADQTISNTTNTTVVLDTEVFDSDNAFASNTFTVPSGKAGKYLFIAQGRITNLNSNKEFQLSFFKNGSSDFSEASQNAYAVQNTYSPDSSSSMYFSHSMIANLSESDAITVSVYHNAGASKTLESTYTRFSGFKLIE